jgi:hypothetical protein
LASATGSRYDVGEDEGRQGQGVSNNESFIDEVTEQVRRERLFGLLRRYGWIGALAVLALVGGAAWFEWQRAGAQALAETRGDAMLDAMAAEDPVAALAAIAEAGSAEPVRLLLLAAQEEAAGDPAGARATLETVGALPGLDPLYADLARLKLLMLADEMDPAERLAGLGALSLPGAVYRMPALEQTALVQLETGDVAAARETLAAILEDADVPPGLQARAETLAQALGAAPAAADATAGQ